MPAVRGYWILDDLDEGLGFGEMFPGRRDLGGVGGIYGRRRRSVTVASKRRYRFYLLSLTYVPSIFIFFIFYYFYF